MVIAKGHHTRAIRIEAGRKELVPVRLIRVRIAQQRSCRHIDHLEVFPQRIGRSVRLGFPGQTTVGGQIEHRAISRKEAVGIALMGEQGPLVQAIRQFNPGQTAVNRAVHECFCRRRAILTAHLRITVKHIRIIGIHHKIVDQRIGCHQIPHPAIII